MGAGARWRCVDYWVRRARLSLAMVEQLDLARPSFLIIMAFDVYISNW